MTQKKIKNVKFVILTSTIVTTHIIYMYLINVIYYKGLDQKLVKKNLHLLHFLIP